MQHEFNIVCDIYKEVINDKGEADLVLIRKNLKKKWFCRNVYEISEVKEVINDNRRIIKNKCEVYSRYENKWVTIEGNYKDVVSLINKKTIIKGYGIQS